MKTILAAALAALLAAGITAYAGNRGEPVHDAQAAKQLKQVNDHLDAVERRLDTLGEIERDTSDAARNTLNTCRAIAQYPYTECPGY